MDEAPYHEIRNFLRLIYRTMVEGVTAPFSNRFLFLATVLPFLSIIWIRLRYPDNSREDAFYLLSSFLVGIVPGVLFFIVGMFKLKPKRPTRFAMSVIYTAYLLLFVLAIHARFSEGGLGDAIEEVRPALGNR
jgi:hypothetical protein